MAQTSNRWRDVANDWNGKGRQPRAADAARPRRDGARQVRAGCIGRGHAGKTALFRAMIEGPIGDYFPSGLHVDVGNPKEAAQMIRDSDETRRVLEKGGLPATLETPEIRYYLYDGDEQRAIYTMREVIGQVLTHTLPGSDGELQARYDEYLKSLLDTHVIWTVIPCPPPNPGPRDRRRYSNDLRITSAYLREALRQRTTGQPCAVAMVVSKIDTLFENEQEARGAFTAQTLTDALSPLVNTVQRSGRVANAAIIPITAFGFGNAVRQDLSADHPPREANQGENPFGDEPVWLLKEGATLEPYNLSTLILWTLLFGLLHQLAAEGGGDDETDQVCQMLHGDLYAEDRWMLPVKGQLVPVK